MPGNINVNYPLDESQLFELDEFQVTVYNEFEFGFVRGVVNELFVKT